MALRPQGVVLPSTEEHLERGAVEEYSPRSRCHVIPPSPPLLLLYSFVIEFVGLQFIYEQLICGFHVIVILLVWKWRCQ